MRNSRRWFCALAFVALLASGASASRDNGKITVPVMTPLTVTLDRAVGARTAVNGQEFTATLKEPVQVGRVTVIPVNASAGGLVSKDRQPGSEMELNSVFVNGRMYRITTSPIALNEKTTFRAGSTVTFYLTFSLNVAR